MADGILCQECRALDISGLVQDLDGCGSFPPLLHHADHVALTTAVAAGCKLCEVLLASIVGETAVKLGLDPHAASMKLAQDDRDNSGGFLVAYNQWGVHYQRAGQHLDSHDDDEDPLDIWDNTYVRTRWCSMTGQTESLPGRVIPVDHDFDLYKKWIWDCSKDHEACGTIASLALPSRVLDLESHDSGGELGMRLVESTNMQGIYVALSHCWGKTKKPVTTSINYEAYLKDIPMTTLPPTFYDAVTATRKLGFRYLWVDCFCIVQDSKQDWERECSQMARIFANAAVTIAGPEAENSDAGFLFPRPTPAFEPIDFPLELSNEGEADTIRLVAMSPEDVGGDTTGVGSEGDAPLRSRAWVLQERLLSHRNLYFGRRQTYFECQKASWAEGSWTQCVVAPFPRGKTEFSSSRAIEEDANNWYSLVGYHYNECGLTVSHDKLPALSGLASKFQALHQSTYAAGVWIEDFPKCLAWIKYFRMKATQSWRDEPKTVRFDTVPTWSWAHIKGLVVWWQYEKILRATLRLKAYDVAPRGKDAFGVVTHGRLTLEGHLEQAVIMTGEDSPWQGRGPILDVCDPLERNAKVAMFFPDFSEPEAVVDYSKPRAVVCLQVGVYEYDSSAESERRDCWIALVLVPLIDEENTYQRVGVAVRSQSPKQGEVLVAAAGWFEKADLHVVNLV
ncbi:hypothetical protein LTR78_009161 [Recurvomyces mirabilis]|uniref:Heterokaryon incompatibility domain-containing protein n=1 Tax=Recurvomyces mirabilis TaxID=574656 RepID=A0AAE0WIQ5_9PEZI|nr:hypothetical protein LTR78_009161 [Recurvomyces mirabilis]KAK5155679.1 hypothetical protein LTS14_005940 [Recurvomyces mirabilis]